MNGSQSCICPARRRHRKCHRRNRKTTMVTMWTTTKTGHRRVVRNKRTLYRSRILWRPATAGLRLRTSPVGTTNRSNSTGRPPFRPRENPSTRCRAAVPVAAVTTTTTRGTAAVVAKVPASGARPPVGHWFWRLSPLSRTSVRRGRRDRRTPWVRSLRPAAGLDETTDEATASAAADEYVIMFSFDRTVYILLIIIRFLNNDNNQYFNFFFRPLPPTSYKLLLN